jgi:hypothetical protein
MNRNTMNFRNYTYSIKGLYLKTPLLLLIILGFSSCFLKDRHNDIKEEILEVQKNHKSLTYVVTYIVKVKKATETEKETFSLVEANKAQGYLKSGNGFNKNEEDNVFQVDFLDKDKNVIATSSAKNPLTKHFEAPNESGKIESKTVTVTEEVIGVRVNYNPSIVSMRFYKPASPNRILLQELNIESE